MGIDGGGGTSFLQVMMVLNVLEVSMNWKSQTSIFYSIGLKGPSISLIAIFGNSNVNNRYPNSPASSMIQTNMTEMYPPFLALEEGRN